MASTKVLCVACNVLHRSINVLFFLAYRCEIVQCCSRGFSLQISPSAVVCCDTPRYRYFQAKLRRLRDAAHSFRYRLIRLW